MEEARAVAQRNAALVATLTSADKLAGIFECPPPDAEAASTFAGLLLHCAASMLYMVRTCFSPFLSLEITGVAENPDPGGLT